MKKQDLQNFDIVETRNGNLYMVNVDKGVVFGIYGWAFLGSYEDDLTDAGFCEEARDYDIVRVRRMSGEYQHTHSQWGQAPIIWERKRTPKLSTFELSFLEKTGMKYMARNKNGNLAFFENEPYKDRNANAWSPRSGASGNLKYDILGELFSFIAWEDESPWSVLELLEAGELEEEKSVNRNEDNQ